MISSSTTIAVVSVPPIRLQANDPFGKAQELHFRLAHQAEIPEHRATEWLNAIETALRREEGRP